MSNNRTHADRVLELNRAGAILADLTHHASLLSNLDVDDETSLAEAVEHLLIAARGDWLHRPTGMPDGEHDDMVDHYRTGAIERARYLADRAERVATAAEALALTLLDHDTNPDRTHDQ